MIYEVWYTRWKWVYVKFDGNVSALRVHIQSVASQRSQTVAELLSGTPIGVLRDLGINLCIEDAVLEMFE